MCYGHLDVQVSELIDIPQLSINKSYLIFIEFN